MSSSCGAATRQAANSSPIAAAAVVRSRMKIRELTESCVVRSAIAAVA